MPKEAPVENPFNGKGLGNLVQMDMYMKLPKKEGEEEIIMLPLEKEVNSIGFITYKVSTEDLKTLKEAVIKNPFTFNLQTFEETLEGWYLPLEDEGYIRFDTEGNFKSFLDSNEDEHLNSQLKPDNVNVIFGEETYSLNKKNNYSINKEEFILLLEKAGDMKDVATGAKPFEESIISLIYQPEDEDIKQDGIKR